MLLFYPKYNGLTTPPTALPSPPALLRPFRNSFLIVSPYVSFPIAKRKRVCVHLVGQVEETAKNRRRLLSAAQLSEWENSKMFLRETNSAPI